ncbi:hypothetical protein NM092_003549 [Vibrio cholerae]|uniref:hypothetical protein n=1 Tax=Vibrio cholerae TaxID=666 RepID=UPI001A1FC656|nr:hypothetical protein [Vibrio cholerae]EMC0408322.1 hypothetical protein [Vibrio fluvialis]EGQ7642240.1 hypothetical protein [Vibrio cholerae]EGR4140660.1 hypothetical protein [Vibrio cholerae]EJL7929560.1 hypothetical protein [Vibrio cholerae]ELI0377377.1 hypothetical protein [Vibrio cholerae]
MGADTFLPGILLALAFFLKLSVDREVDIPNTIYAILELPVDILFLATSFIVAFTIAAKPPVSTTGFMYFGAYLLVSAITVFTWRKACRCFERGHIKTTIFISVVNYSLCVTALIRAIQII